MYSFLFLFLFLFNFPSASIFRLNSLEEDVLLKRLLLSCQLECDQLQDDIFEEGRDAHINSCDSYESYNSDSDDSNNDKKREKRELSILTHNQIVERNQDRANTSVDIERDAAKAR